VKKKVLIQISKLEGNKKQAKYDQKVITVLKIKTKTKANTKTTKTKKNIKNKPKSKDKNNESRRL